MRKFIIIAASVAAVVMTALVMVPSAFSQGPPGECPSISAAQANKMTQAIKRSHHFTWRNEVSWIYTMTQWGKLAYLDITWVDNGGTGHHLRTPMQNTCPLAADQNPYVPGPDAPSGNGSAYIPGYGYVPTP